MRVHRSVIKRARQNERRRLRNSMTVSRVRTAIRAVREAPDGAKAQAAFLAAGPLLDRAAGKGVIHPRTAARRKSRLARYVKSKAAATA
jgi:small subunit ribosomal protein S20